MFNIDKIKATLSSAARKAKQVALALTDLEMKVEEATNAETWGPHGQILNEICDEAFDTEGYRQIMGILAQRLQERGTTREKKHPSIPFQGKGLSFPFPCPGRSFPITIRDFVSYSYHMTCRVGLATCIQVASGIRSFAQERTHENRPRNPLQRGHL
jgi:hypothetical protein